MQASDASSKSSVTTGAANVMRANSPVALVTIVSHCWRQEKVNKKKFGVGLLYKYTLECC